MDKMTEETAGTETTGAEKATPPADLDARFAELMGEVKGLKEDIGKFAASDEEFLALAEAAEKASKAKEEAEAKIPPPVKRSAKRAFLAEKQAEYMAQGYDQENAYLKGEEIWEKKILEEALKPVLEKDSRRDQIARTYADIATSGIKVDISTAGAAARWAVEQGLVGKVSPGGMTLLYLHEHDLMGEEEPPPSSPGFDDFGGGGRRGSGPNLPPELETPGAKNIAAAWGLSSEDLEKYYGR